MLTSLILLTLTAPYAGSPLPAPAPLTPLSGAPLQESVARGGQPASLIPFSYVEVGYGTLSGFRPNAGIEADVQLLNLVGSLELSSMVHVFAGGGLKTNADIESEGEISGTKFSRWFAGMGMHQALSESLTGFARISVSGESTRASWLVQDPTNPGTYTPQTYKASGSSAVYSVGLRSFLGASSEGQGLELSLTANIADAPGAEVNFEAAMLHRATREIGVGLVASFPGDSDQGKFLGFGTRWYF